MAEQKKSSFWQDFRDFAIRGNVIDMAVGVIVGGAFGKITTSLVNDLLMPLILMITGDVSLENLSVNLSALQGIETETPNLLRYGNFIQVILDFIIIAFCIFLFVRVITVMRTKAEAKKKAEEEARKAEEEAKKKAEEEAAAAAAAAVTPEDIALLREIRDLLKK